MCVWTTVMAGATAAKCRRTMETVWPMLVVRSNPIQICICLLQWVSGLIRKNKSNTYTGILTLCRWTGGCTMVHTICKLVIFCFLVADDVLHLKYHNSIQLNKQCMPLQTATFSYIKGCFWRLVVMDSIKIKCNIRLWSDISYLRGFFSQKKFFFFKKCAAIAVIG